MRVSVDFERCEGFGLCMSEAPEVFELDDDARLRLLAEHPPEAAGNRVEAAARACPKQAITIED